MRNITEFPGITAEGIEGAASSDDNDLRLRMGEIGKSVTLLWPANIERILGTADNSRLARRLAGMAQKIVGKTATGGSRDQVINREK